MIEAILQGFPVDSKIEWNEFKLPNEDPAKHSQKSNGLVAGYAANTN